MGETPVHTNKRPAFGRFGIAALLLTGAMALGACTAQFRNHGYMPAPEEVAAVQPGVDTVVTVAEKLGKPTTSGVLDQSGYYYVRSRFRHYAYQEPKLVGRELLAVTFAENGRVRNIERFGIERGRTVALTRRITESGDRPNNFLASLIQRLGNFDASSVLGGS